ncbi:MAG: hypothetical protein FWG67_03485 [Defluviitaleaceae bacterium]|nr:hypothetical protein [Defluviitaleaceae bacterium]
MDNFKNDFKDYEEQPNHEINSRYGRSPYKEYRSLENDTEFATDFLTSDGTDGNSTSGALIAGMLSMLASIAALFTYPLFLGIVGIALGCFSVAKGNKVIGYIGIGVGVLAMVISMLYRGSFISLF